MASKKPNTQELALSNIHIQRHPTPLKASQQELRKWLGWIAILVLLHTEPSGTENSKMIAVSVFLAGFDSLLLQLGAGDMNIFAAVTA